MNVDDLLFDFFVDMPLYQTTLAKVLGEVDAIVLAPVVCQQEVSLIKSFSTCSDYIMTYWRPGTQYDALYALTQSSAPYKVVATVFMNCLLI